MPMCRCLSTRAAVATVYSAFPFAYGLKICSYGVPKMTKGTYFRFDDYRMKHQHYIGCDDGGLTDDAKVWGVVQVGDTDYNGWYGIHHPRL